MELVLREYTRRDRACVATRWRHSYSARRAGVDRGTYRARHGLLIDALLDRARVVVASTPRAPAVVLGFAVAEAPDVLHYVHVARELCGDGLARAMVQHALGTYPEHVRCTHAWPWASRRFVHDWYPLALKEKQDGA